MDRFDKIAKGLSYDIALLYCKERHLYCPLAESLIPKIAAALRAARDEGLEEACKTIRGEAELYEEQAKTATKARIKKIQKRWVKLKEVERRIHALKSDAGKP